MDESLEKHFNMLQKLCRLCGEMIKSNKSYKTPKNVTMYETVLADHYRINLTSETDESFPKQLCGNCKRKLDRLREKMVDNSLQAAKFMPHETNCSICKGQTLTIRSRELHINELDKIMTQFGFNIVNATSMEVDIKRMYSKMSVKSDGLLQNDIVFKVYFDNHYKCFVYGKETNIEVENPLNDNSINVIENFFKSKVICIGIKEYGDIIQSRLEISDPFQDAAEVESESAIKLLKAEEYTVVRAKDCKMFANEAYSMCASCNKYLKTLRVFKSRQKGSTDQNKRQRVSDDSKTNYRYLSSAEKDERMANLQKSKKLLSQKVVMLNANIKDLIEADGVAVEDEQHDAFAEVITNDKEPNFEVDSPQWLLWQQQKLQASKTDSRGMRWHPLIIRWCLSILHTSAAAYKQMSNAKLNFLRLPSISTLREYTHFTKTRTGFNPDILSRLMIEAKVTNTDEKGRQVVVSFDEMKIKSQLVYQKGTGRLIGFTEMGDINDEFTAFASAVESTSEKANRDFATHVLVFMARGIFSNLSYPFGYFGTLGATSTQLYTCCMDAVRVLHAINLNVRAFVSDGAAPNRRFYNILKKSTKETFYTINPHNPGQRIYFFSDVPHLLKTTRNCYENSHWNKRTRNLMLDDLQISWQHIIDVFEEDMGIYKGVATNESLGLRKLNKLTEDHVKLSSRSRMTVKLAAQVLSQTMCNALKSQNRPATKSTIQFIDIIDRVFDCLNVSNVNKDRNSKKELTVYTKPDDWRFEFLEKEFVEGFLVRWESQIEALKDVTKEEKNKMLLSVQTRKGWKMTVSSFVNLSKELLNIDGVKFLLSEKFTQDPLEEHFGRHRRRGGCNDNPTLAQYGQQEITLNVMGSSLIRDIQGNTRGRDKEDVKISTDKSITLPKRKKCRK